MKNFKECFYTFISKNINYNSKVLDLGCGDGTLLKYLIDTKKVKGQGVDIDFKEIINCIKKGIPVIQLDLDYLPLDFADNSYDVVILTQTLQQVYHPELLISEILRIGKEAILSFPNFGNYQVRFKYVFTGKMPITKELPNKWYNTPNIKLFTIKDFYDFCKEFNIEIVSKYFLKREGNIAKEVKILPNIFADIAIFKIRKKI